MRTATSETSKLRLLFASSALGAIAAFVTAAAASIAAPQGPLVVVLIPALLVGFACFGLSIWRFRCGESIGAIWQSAKELWHAFGKSSL